MSHYRRLISYIYAYEGSVKGKNIGYAKIEIRGGQCRIQANVRHIYVGGGEIGVYLLTPGEELFLGRIFIRNGAGEYHAQINPDDIDGSGCRIDQCYGLTIHDVENAWHCWMTIWEDAVAQTAELELADVTAENQRMFDRLDRDDRNDKKWNDEEPENAEKELSDVIIETDAVTADDAVTDSVQESKEKRDKECRDGGQNEEDQNDILKEKVPEEKAQKPENPVEEKACKDQKDIDQKGIGQEDSGRKEMRTDDTKKTVLEEGISEKDVLEKGISDESSLSGQESEKQTLSGQNPEAQSQEGQGQKEKDQEEQRAEERDLEKTERIKKDSENKKQETQEDSVAKLMAGIRTAISGNGTASGFLSSAIRTVQNIGMEHGGISEKTGFEDSSKEDDIKSEEPRNQEHRELEERLQKLWKEKQEKNEKKKPDSQAEPFPELENTAFLKELDRLERKNRGADHLWEQLQRRYVRVLAFDYEKGCEILSIRPQDIGLLPREIWHYGNNSFLLHGYYNYRHLILARMNNPQGPYRYLLGVPGHYFSNEKYLASMFGFPHFVLARKQPDRDGRFGYWYTEIRL